MSDRQIVTSTIIADGATDKGPHRDENQDAWHIERIVEQNNDEYLFVVADGIGGLDEGARAAQLAVETIFDVYRQEREFQSTIQNALSTAVKSANDAIREERAAQALENKMGSTVVAVVCRGTKCTIAHVGDSRVYLQRGRRLTQLTTDHSLVQEQVDAGIISEAEAKGISTATLSRAHWAKTLTSMFL